MTRKNISNVIKILIGTSAFLGLVLASVFAIRDGYLSWHKRLLYFTQMSNIWIGSLCFFMTFYRGENKKTKHVLSIFKFVFTISIAITGIIYCCFLAPFAEDDYNAWTLGSILSHVITPILSVIDLFVDDANFEYKKCHALYSLIPPFLYMIFALVLGALNVDFGRGETYPYFFLNFKSNVGFFGFENGNPPQFGSMYWIILFLFVVLSISFLLRWLHKKINKK